VRVTDTAAQDDEALLGADHPEQVDAELQALADELRRVLAAAVQVRPVAGDLVPHTATARALADALEALVAAPSAGAVARPYDPNRFNPVSGSASAVAPPLRMWTVTEGPDGPEVLVVERSSASRFLPGYVAFPGGAVDAEDSGLAARWFGDPADAARAAAIRELIEEANVAITGSGARRVTASDALACVDAEPPRREAFHEIAHWVAPEDVPVRFDARFFAVAVDRGVEPVADGGETAAAWWMSPRTLLDEWSRSARKLYWPTWLTMHELARCDSVEALLSLRMETREPGDDELATMPPSVFWQDR